MARGLKAEVKVMKELNGSEQKNYLYHDIAGRIERMIEGGELGGGARLPAERSLARQFGVSRICVRQAIQALSAKNILESRRGDGTYVRDPDPAVAASSFASVIAAQKEAVKDILEFRLLMEPQIAWLAAKNISGDEIDRLKIIVCDQERKNLAGQDDQALDAAFHMQLAQSCGNRVIRKIMDTIHDILNESRSELLQSRARRKASINGHLRIIDSLEAGDPDSAFEAMREHLQEVERTIFGTDDNDECVE